MNKVIMCGRLTRDPEVRSTGNTTIARFSIAVERRIKREGQPEADFFNCISYGKQAEFIDKYVKKGMKVFISGRIENDNYTNKEGQKVYSTQISIEEIEIAEWKKEEQKEEKKEERKDDFMSIPEGMEEELPFN